MNKAAIVNKFVEYKLIKTMVNQSVAAPLTQGGRGDWTMTLFITLVIIGL